MRFFERGRDARQSDARVYTNIFSRLTTRYVYWQLDFAYPPQPERIDFEIEAVYYRPDGTVMRSNTTSHYVDKGWTGSGSSRGRGWRAPQQWPTGLYKVELFIEEQLVASGEFEIVDSRIPIEGPFTELREGLAWASLPWSFEEEVGLLPLAGLMETDTDLASSVASLPWVRESPTDEGARVLQLLDILAREDVELAKWAVGLPWLADDVSKDEWLALRALTLFAVMDASIARFIADFQWLNDDITEDERRTIRDLRYIAVEHPSLAETLLGLPWLGDRLTEQESRVVGYFKDLARRDVQVAHQVAGTSGPVRVLHHNAVWALQSLYDIDPTLVSSLSAREWFTDGLDEDEATVLKDLSVIGRRSEAAVLTISRMPLLDTFEPADALATTALRLLASFNSEDDAENEGVGPHFRRVMDHPRVADGITDEETKVVATLFGVSKYNPDLVDTLLDPDKVDLEDRTINLPLAGETQVTIIRTRPGAERTMDLLKKLRALSRCLWGHISP